MASAAEVLPIASNKFATSPAADEAALLIVPMAPDISLKSFALLREAKPFLKVSNISSHLFSFLPVPSNLSSAFLNFSKSAGLFSIASSCSLEINVISSLSPFPER